MLFLVFTLLAKALFGLVCVFGRLLYWLAVSFIEFNCCLLTI